MSLTDLGAADLAALVAARQLSSVEICTAFLDRIETLNPALNALVSLRPRAEVLAEAAQADAEIAASGPRGPLHGLPIAPKDLAATKGLRTTWGSTIYRDHIPDADGVMAARLRAAGAIFVGKSNTPEFGLGSHTFNEVFGTTLNPWDRTRSAGGSSGGAAAALAARLLPVADGSDMMGSLRNPAAWNGVYGFRPSFGLVPLDAPGDRFMATLATEGPMGRSVRDVALLLDVMAGEAPGVPFGRPADGFVAALDGPPETPRIGWLGDWGGAWAVEDGILPLCKTALRQMEPQLGATIVPLRPPLPAADLWRSWLMLRAFLNANSRAALYADPALRAQLKPEMIWEIEQGRDLTTAALYEASVTRTRWYQRLADLFRDVDLIALPAAQVWPFDANLRWPDTVTGRPLDTYHRWMEVAVPPALAGLPTVAVPVGMGGAEGTLPMGMQLAGPVGADARVLRFAHRWNGVETVSRSKPPGC